MKRFLLTVLVSVSVTGLLGAGQAMAQMMMSTGSTGGGFSGGSSSVPGIGWTAESPGVQLGRRVKAKTSPPATGVAGPAGKAPGTAVATKGGETTVAYQAAATNVANAGAATVPNKAAATNVANAGAATAVPNKAAAGPASVGGIFPMVVSGADSKLDVKNLENGVSFTITSTDPAMAARLQKMAEAMRLMQEAMHP